MFVGTGDLVSPLRKTHRQGDALPLQFVLEHFMMRRVVMSKMSVWAKAGLVIVGYVLACLVAGGAVYVNGLLTPDAVKQASGGMSAFGDLILLAGAFGLCALFPTGLALYFIVRAVISRRQNDGV